jgi:hypothetical protein
MPNKVITRLEVPYTVRHWTRSHGWKNYPCNLNPYGNWNGFLRNTLKKKYAQNVDTLIDEEFKDIKISGKVQITYQLHCPRGKMDVDKFVPRVIFEYIGYSKETRVFVQIEEYCV